MKKLFVTFLILASSLAGAETVRVLETDIGYVDPFRSLVATRFYMDQDSSEGFAKVSVSTYHYTGYPGGMGYPNGSSYNQVIFQDTVQVLGLSLVDGKAVYQGQSGEVVCGSMGTSRVFRRPTLFLNGNCQLEGRIVRQDGRFKVLVDFITK